jgi:hypothetical protein
MAHAQRSGIIGRGCGSALALIAAIACSDPTSVQVPMLAEHYVLVAVNGHPLPLELVYFSNADSTRGVSVRLTGGELRIRGDTVSSTLRLTAPDGSPLAAELSPPGLTFARHGETLVLLEPDGPQTVRLRGDTLQASGWTFVATRADGA